MRDPRFAKFVILVNGAVPLALVMWDGYNEALGPDPVNAELHTTGVMALIFLLLSLSVTPVRKIMGWNWLSHFRRMLGLYAFFYASLHFSIYFFLDENMRIKGLVEDVLHGRTFIIYGLTALVLLIPLAVTSTNEMIKRMGAAKWKALHRLVYPAAIAAVVHYWKTGKSVPPPARVFAWVLAVLLGYRVVAPLWRRVKWGSRVQGFQGSRVN